MSFSQKLRELRLANCMTQEYVAECIHVSRSTIAGYETKNRQPSHEKLAAIADLFNVPVDYLLEGDNMVSFTPARLTTNSIDERNFLLRYRNLSPSSRQDLHQYMSLLEEKEQHSL